jgi:hypothetical protein
MLRRNDGQPDSDACDDSRRAGQLPPSGVPRRRYTTAVATTRPRIQVTVDDVLARALARVDANPRSRSKLVRDLALRGAQAVERERAGRQAAVRVLLEIADGARDYDLEASAAIARHRHDRLP